MEASNAPRPSQSQWLQDTTISTFQANLLLVGVQRYANSSEESELQSGSDSGADSVLYCDLKSFVSEIDLASLRVYQREKTYCNLTFVYLTKKIDFLNPLCCTCNQIAPCPNLVTFNSPIQEILPNNNQKLTENIQLDTVKCDPLMP